MEELEKQIEELPTEPKQGSGSILATARKQQQRTIEEIADELNLSVTQIKAIELDQTEGLPEPTYVRGYIRAYAKLLGLKPEEVLHNYLNENWQQSSSLNDIPRGIGRAEDGGPRFFTIGRVVILLVIAAILGALWYSGIMQQLIVGRAATEPSEAVEESVGDVRSVASTSDIGDVSVEAEEIDATETTAAQTDPQDDTLSENEDGEVEQLAAESNDSPDTVAEPQDPASNRLVMRFTATSWVDIRDGNDDRLAYKSYTDGDVLEIDEIGEMQVFVGNAEGVEVTLNGEGFNLGPHREGVYAKFVIPASQ